MNVSLIEIYNFDQFQFVMKVGKAFVTATVTGTINKTAKSISYTFYTCRSFNILNDLRSPLLRDVVKSRYEDRDDDKFHLSIYICSNVYVSKYIDS